MGAGWIIGRWMKSCNSWRGLRKMDDIFCCWKSPYLPISKFYAAWLQVCRDVQRGIDTICNRCWIREPLSETTRYLSAEDVPTVKNSSLLNAWMVFISPGKGNDQYESWRLAHGEIFIFGWKFIRTSGYIWQQLAEPVLGWKAYRSMSWRPPINNVSFSGGRIRTWWGAMIACMNCWGVTRLE